MPLLDKKIAHYIFIKNLYVGGHFIKNKRWAQESKTNEEKNDEKKREVTNEKKMNTHTQPKKKELKSRRRAEEVIEERRKRKKKSNEGNDRNQNTLWTLEEDILVQNSRAFCFHFLFTLLSILEILIFGRSKEKIVGPHYFPHPSPPNQRLSPIFSFPFFILPKIHSTKHSLGRKKSPRIN